MTATCKLSLDLVGVGVLPRVARTASAATCNALVDSARAWLPVAAKSRMHCLLVVPPHTSSALVLVALSISSRNTGTKLRLFAAAYVKPASYLKTLSASVTRPAEQVQCYSRFYNYLFGALVLKEI